MCFLLSEVRYIGREERQFLLLRPGPLSKILLPFWSLPLGMGHHVNMAQRTEESWHRVILGRSPPLGLVSCQQRVHVS